MAEYGSRRGHQDRAQPRSRRLDDCLELISAFLLKMVGELDNQDSILRYQADQGDQSHLAINVERRKSEKRERQSRGKGQRH